MDHKTFLASLTASERAILTTTSNSAGLRHLAVHIACLTLTSVMITWGWWIAILPQGILLIFLFTLLHEASHHTVFRTRWLNDAVAAICGLILLIPSQWFRYFHLAHHRHTHDPAKDPELAKPKPETWPTYIWHISGIPVWTSLTKGLLRNAVGRATEDYIPARRRNQITLEARILLLLYAALALASALTGSALLLWLWIIPIIIGQPFLRLYLLAEHGRCPHVADMFANTRTTFTNAAMRRLAWNMPYHAEHHVFPTVPFHKLPALHTKVQAHLKATSDGYTAFHRDYSGHLTR